MKKRHHTSEQIVTKLRKVEALTAEGATVAEAAKQAGLQVPQRRPRKRRRLGTSENGCLRLKATYPNHVWSYDFLYDRTEDGRQLKIMPVVDEYTRECLAVVVGRSITAQDVICKFDALFDARGAPAQHPRLQDTGSFCCRA